MNVNPVSRRLLREFKKFQQDQTKAYTVSISPESVMNWSVVLFGPDGTEWEGAAFRLSVVFPDNYPQQPPDVHFMSPIPFHPNVYASGKICIDILQHNWCSAYELSSVLTSLHALLVDPNPSSPANSEAARIFVEDRNEYRRRVKKCVESTWCVSTSPA
jgi:ubiquitin-conjugating enzyme E2 A